MDIEDLNVTSRICPQHRDIGGEFGWYHTYFQHQTVRYIYFFKTVMLINWWNPLTAIDIEIRGMLLVHFNDTSPVICVGWRIDRCENKICTCNLWHTKVRIVCVCPTLHLYAQNFFTHAQNISTTAKLYYTSAQNLFVPNLTQ